jgi:hypothetical protein
MNTTAVHFKQFIIYFNSTLILYSNKKRRVSQPFNAEWLVKRTALINEIAVKQVQHETWILLAGKGKVVPKHILKGIKGE